MFYYFRRYTLTMKKILITGVSGNLGQAVMQKFLGEGYMVIGTLIPNDPHKPDIKNPAFQAVEANLMDESAAGRMVEDLYAEFSRIDAAVLTVGGFAMGDIAGTASADIMKQISLNFNTAYHVARPLLAKMRQQGTGRIFLIGSRPGADMRNGKGMTAYALAKSLIFRLAELMNEETAGTGIVTSVIVPSTIDTPQNRAAMPEADFNRWVNPADIAETIFYYCSEAGASIREPLIKIYNKS